MSHPPIDGQITFLYTGDLKATARFYEKTMGLPLKLDQGTCRIYRVGSKGYLGFCQREAVSKETKRANSRDIILTILTPKVDEWYHYLSQKGVTFEKAPALNPKYNIYHCFLRDPNGYLIEIQRFIDPF